MKTFSISKIKISVILLCVGFFGFSQIEIEGKVIDSTLALPLENASIYVQKTTVGTVSNSDGKFVLQIADEFLKDTLVVSSIGFKSFKIPVEDYGNPRDIFLIEDVASLDEVLIVAETRPTTGNDIVLRAIERLSENMPDSAYLQKGFLRHKERNKIEFKWLIESAITLYDSGYGSKSNEYLKLNVDQVRKSYDLRDIDSVFSYVAYKNRNRKRKLKAKDINPDELSRKNLVKAIRWNDTRVNGMQNLFHGKLNVLRNAQNTKALFNKNLLSTHQFSLDTILVDNDRKIYKIQISESTDFIGLNTKGIYNEGFTAKGWLYIYYDNYAIKKVEYELVAASERQKSRSKRLFDTQVNHKLVISYMEYEDKMYPNYIYYETPKLVNVGLKSKEKVTKAEQERYNKEERYYYTIQEILFSEVILDRTIIEQRLQEPWNMDIFSSRPYNKEFWKNYNILLESEEDEQLIEDLSQRASLFED